MELLLVWLRCFYWRCCCSSYCVAAAGSGAVAGSGAFIGGVVVRLLVLLEVVLLVWLRCGCWRCGCVWFGCVAVVVDGGEGRGGVVDGIGGEFGSVVLVLALLEVVVVMHLLALLLMVVVLALLFLGGVTKVVHAACFVFAVTGGFALSISMLTLALLLAMSTFSLFSLFLSASLLSARNETFEHDPIKTSTRFTRIPPQSLTKGATVYFSIRFEIRL